MSDMLRVVLPFATLEDFVAQYAGCITEGGIFLPVEPQPLRTKVHLEVQLLTGEVALRAAGVVSFVTAPGKRGHPGMGIRFANLDERSFAVVRRACAGRETDPQLPPLPESVAMAEGEAAPPPGPAARSAPPPREPTTPVPRSAGPKRATLPKAPVRMRIRVPEQAVVTASASSPTLLVATRTPLPLWTKLDLEVSCASAAAAWPARGEVISSSGNSLTVRLSGLSHDAERKLRQAGGAAAPTSLVSPRIASLCLSDEMLADGAAEMLCEAGIAAFDGLPADAWVDLVVADAAHLLVAARRFPQARLIAVNLSGPDALVGEASRLKPRAFLKKPVSVSGLFGAVVSELGPAASPSRPSAPRTEGVSKVH